jgi:DNA-binding HxlR family transcriptional regulator
MSRVRRVARERAYVDACAAAHALDLVGERWALLVVRELLFGPKRFTDLRAGIPDVSADVLGRRLRELEQTGVVQRRKLAPPAGSWVYELTDWGYELEAVVVALGRWGSRSPAHRVDGELGVDSLALAFRADFEPAAAEGLDTSYELRFGEHRFRVAVAGGKIDVARGSASDPDATIDTDPGTFASLLWGGRSLDDAVRAGAIAIEGSTPAVERFLRLFPLSEPAAAP